MTTIITIEISPHHHRQQDERFSPSEDRNHQIFKFFSHQNTTNFPKIIHPIQSLPRAISSPFSTHFLYPGIRPSIAIQATLPSVIPFSLSSLQWCPSLAFPTQFLSIMSRQFRPLGQFIKVGRGEQDITHRPKDLHMEPSSS